MPYKKTYRKGRKSYRKRGAKRGQIYGAAAGQLWKDVKMLKDAINVEYKVRDAVATQNPSTTATTVLLNGLQKGDDYNNRDGRQVRWKSIQMYLRTQLHASATQSTMRVIVFIDKQSSESSATGAGLLDLTTASAVDAFRNLSNRKRFVVLMDKRVVVNTDFPEKVTKWYKKIDMKTIYDDGDAGTVADITTNAIYALYCSDEATNVPAVVQNFRLRFIDN